MSLELLLRYNYTLTNEYEKRRNRDARRHYSALEKKRNGSDDTLNVRASKGCSWTADRQTNRRDLIRSVAMKMQCDVIVTNTTRVVVSLAHLCNVIPASQIVPQHLVAVGHSDPHVTFVINPDYTKILIFLAFRIPSCLPTHYNSGQFCSVYARLVSGIDTCGSP
ncbi:hypothetical protein J6590_090332 [Homalodisca vitripennis]|nr:hypothetical protein J6590_090332 [Homalodisca vitripennis]